MNSRNDNILLIIRRANRQTMFLLQSLFYTRNCKFI